MQLAAFNRPEALQIAQAAPDLVARLCAENPQKFEAMVELIAVEKARALEVAYSGYYIFPIRVEGVGLVGEVYVSLARLEGRAPWLFGEVAIHAKSGQHYQLTRQLEAAAFATSAQGFRLVVGLEVLP